MRPAIWICVGIYTAICILFAQTMVGPGQLANIAQLPSHFGFNCTSAGSSTVCEIDRAYMMHLWPVPWAGTGIAPSPGACFDTAGVIITKEPAMYFCASPPPGGFGPIWIRVSGVSTW